MIRLHLILLLTPLVLASPFQIPFVSNHPTIHDGTASSIITSTSSKSTSTTRVVPLSLGVMSKCPDAEICETLIDRVLDTHTGRRKLVDNSAAAGGRPEIVGDLVKLELVYLAKENSTSESRTFGNLTCLHGPLECQANVQQLCAAHHWSKSRSADVTDAYERRETGQWKDWWNFVQCMNYGKRDEVGRDALARSCAKVVGKEWTKELEDCASDSPTSQGAELFRKSVETSKKLEIEKSCTIVLNRRKLCVHDGSWKECPGGHEVGDIVQAVKSEFDRINSRTDF